MYVHVYISLCKYLCVYIYIHTQHILHIHSTGMRSFNVGFLFQVILKKEGCQGMNHTKEGKKDIKEERTCIIYIYIYTNIMSLLLASNRQQTAFKKIPTRQIRKEQRKVGRGERRKAGKKGRKGR